MNSPHSGSQRGGFPIEPFLDYLSLERGLKPRTVASYRSDLKGFVTFASRSGLEGPEGIDHLVLDRYVAEMAERGTAPSSIRRAQSALRAYFGFLASEGDLERDPTDRMERPKAAKKLPEFLTQTEAARLVEAVDPDSKVLWRDRSILELLYATGMRVSELTNLSLRDVDLEYGTCLVLGKGGKERVVPMGTHAVRALTRYLDQVRGALLKARSGGALFLNQRGGRLSRMAVWNLVSSAS
ncbi:MAG: tyrosine-type recombinase/integrase, partial [Longimicrobiales bacterium]